MSRILKLLILLHLPWCVAADDPFRVVIGFQPPVSALCNGLITEAFGRLGRTVQVRALPAERAIQLANAGVADAECLRIRGIERLYPNLVQVPIPLLEVQFVAFANAKRKLSLAAGWRSLQPYHVGAVYGWKLIEMRVKEVNPRSFVRVDSAEALFRMLDLQRIDVAALNRLDGELQLRRLGIEGIQAIEPPLAQVPLYFSMHLRHRALVPDLQRVLQDMRQDGTWQRIYDDVLRAYGI